MITDRVSPPGTVVPTDGNEPVVSMRIWLISPERLRQGTVRPLLTGIYGYRWPEADLDARCTATRAAHHAFGLPPHAEPYHPVLPDPSCSCGIYAVRADAEVVPNLRTPVGIPTVTGFVALSGRVVAGSRMLRGQHATIIGPLTLLPGRFPPLAGVLRRRPSDVRLVNGAYRVRWSRTGSAEGWSTWARETARLLQIRYGVEVIAPPAHPA